MNILHPKFITTFLFFTVVILLLILLLDVLATASDSNNELQDVVGKKEFVTYCASCHGSDGKGNGPMVNFLKRKPADLTQLSKANNGAFPFDRIYGVFDGTYILLNGRCRKLPAQLKRCHSKRQVFRHAGSERAGIRIALGRKKV